MTADQRKEAIRLADDFFNNSSEERRRAVINRAFSEPKLVAELKFEGSDRDFSSNLIADLIRLIGDSAVVSLLTDGIRVSLIGIEKQREIDVFCAELTTASTESPQPTAANLSGLRKMDQFDLTAQMKTFRKTWKETTGPIAFAVAEKEEDFVKHLTTRICTDIGRNRIESLDPLNLDPPYGDDAIERIAESLTNLNGIHLLLPVYLTESGSETKIFWDQLCNLSKQCSANGNFRLILLCCTPPDDDLPVWANRLDRPHYTLDYCNEWFSGAVAEMGWSGETFDLWYDHFSAYCCKNECLVLWKVYKHLQKLSTLIDRRVAEADFQAAIRKWSLTNAPI